MRTIALLTDFGLSDNFVGVMKGVILRINSRIHLVDISHGIQPQDILSAALLLQSSYNYFPKGTIFVVVVDPGVGSQRNPIIIRSKNYFFVGPDNAVLSLTAKKDGVKKIVKIENKKYLLETISNTFHGRDIFAPVAAHLSQGKHLSLFGRPLHSIKKLDIPKPKVKKDSLAGQVMHIDKFGNLVTNINRDAFCRFTQNKRFSIRIKDKRLNSVVKSYQAVKQGKCLAIFGSSGFLEISLSGSNAQEYLKAKKGTTISIARV